MASQRANHDLASAMDGAASAVGAAGSDFSESHNLTSDSTSNIKGELADLFNVSKHDVHVARGSAESIGARVPVMVARREVVSPGGIRKMSKCSPRQ